MDKRANLTPAQRALLEKRIKGKGPVMPASAQKKTGIPRRPPGESPLSYSQERIWVIEQMEPDAAAYNVPFVVSITGVLDYDLLSKSINEVVRRHEALRTSFQETDGTPTLFIHDELDIPIEIFDIRHVPESERNEAAERLAREEAKRLFDLIHGPLVRVTAIQKADAEHLLMITLHHIISDGWSLGVMINEFSIVYASFQKGLPSPLPELPIQYSDFAYWQKQPEQQAALQQHFEYWKEQLGGERELLQLPTDRPRPSSQTYNGTTTVFSLSKTQSDALQKLSVESGTSLFMTLLAAFQTFLARYTGQSDILVGSPIANRNREELEGLVGVFINTLVHRSRIENGMTFRDLLEKVRRTTLDAFAHQDMPFEKLVEALEQDRNMAYSPLFQTMFILQNNTQRTLSMPGLTLQTEMLDSKTALFDITLSFFETESGLEGYWESNTDLFDQTTVDRMIRHFQTLLSGIVEHPDQLVHQLPLLPPEEQQLLLRDWNGTEQELPQYRIDEMVSAQAERTPETAAVTFQGRSLSYRELIHRANQVAHRLQQLGAGPDVPVGLSMERSLDMIIGLLAIIKAGSAYVPLDPAYPKDRLSYILDETCIPILLTRQGVMTAEVPESVQVIELDTDPTLCEESGENPTNLATLDHLVYILYTSGSTGRPKGVAMPHRPVANLLAWQLREAHKADARTLQFTSLNFDVSFQEIFATLCAGGTLVLLEEAQRQNLLELPDVLIAEKVERLFLPFIALQSLAEVCAERNLFPDSLQEVITAGEQLQSTKAIRRFFSELPHCTLTNQYGPTESHVVTSHTLAGPADSWPLLPPIGRPVANAKLYVLDALLQPVPIGVQGELYLGGPVLARGYIKRDDLTRERFLDNLFAAGEMLYKTGDGVRWLPDRTIEYLGRLDNQVKIRGHRIELGEIETRLTECDQIREAAVIARDNSLIAYVVAEGEELPDVMQLRAYLGERLPEYMVPAAFVQLEAMPLTPSGKIDRQALLALESATLPSVERTYVAPSSPLEKELCIVWSEVLQVEQVGVQDNFFTLGGHSLLATRMMSRVNSRFATHLPLRSLFEAPTIAKLAAVIAEQENEVVAPPIIPAPRNEQLPLSYSQERIWVMEQLEPEAAVYNIPGAFSVSGELDRELLSTSIHEVIRRHEALRTTFPVTDGTPEVLIHEELFVPILELDVRHLPEGERDEAAQRLALEDTQRPFDLIQGPLVRVTTIQKADDEHLLLITLHHIIADGWSISVLINEFSLLYATLKNGLPSPLQELPIQYSDFVYWQKLPEQQAALQQQLEYWKQQLGGELEPLQLPTDRPRPSSQTFCGATTQFMLSKALTDSLQQLSVETGTTLFMTLLAAFQTFLSRYTGQTDILIGSPIANRTRHEIEGLVGVFINTLVHRSRIEGDMTFRDLLETVRHTALDAFAHQDMPFEKLVEELQADRNMTYSPLFQAMFVLQNNEQHTISMPGLTLRSENLETKTAKFDITLSFFETENGLWGHWEYNTDLFDAETIERMILHFQTLLSGIVDKPDRLLHEYPLLPYDEQLKMLRDWNDTAAPSREACIHHLFEEQVERTPDRIALVFEERQLTYRELNNLANHVAQILQSSGVGPEDVVGVYLERSAELLCALLATHKAGGGYLPLDPSYPQDRLAFMIGDAKPKVILTQASLDGQLPPHDAQVLTFSGEEQVDFLPNPASLAQPEHLAYIIYTSGSTGQPKGVMVEHRNAAHLFTGMDQAVGCTEEDTILGLNSFGFDICVIELLWSLVCGVKVILLSEQEVRETVFSVNEFSLRNQMLRHNVTMLLCTPSLMSMIIASDDGLAALSSLQKIMLGAEVLHPALAHQLSRQTNARVFNLYGPTETTVCAAYYEVNGTELGSIPIGRPLVNYTHYVLDAHLQPVPVGVPGELHIGGAGVTRGYLGRDELTAERFIPNPFDPGILYKTGDLVSYLPDGNIKFLGRLDNQVKVRGYRVDLGEIETRLLEQDAIREGVVIARDNTLIAYVVADGELPDDLGIRSFLGARLPEFMVPTRFIQLDAMPLSPSGKIDRKALLALESATLQSFERTYVAPSSPLEKELCVVWSEVLQVEQVGVQDNFFTLGGHSLLAMRVMSKVNSRFATHLSLRSLFEAPTIAKLAAVIAEQQHEIVAPPIIPVSRNEHLPLSFAQERLWFLDQLHPDSVTYNIPVVVWIKGNLDAEVLGKCLAEVVERHESLRTTFKIVDGQPKQFVTDEVTIALPVCDVQSVAEARAVALEEARTPFNLAQGPLLRAKLLRVGQDEHMLLLTMHHIITDEWSMGIFVEEMATFYDAFSTGTSPHLQPLPIQYADYAFWQREWLTGELLQNQLSYWKKQLGGELPILQLPTDFPRPAVLTERGASHTFQLNSEIAGQLNQLSQQEGTTLFMTLLAAFNTLLFRYTDQEDILIGTPIAGRRREEIDALIGFFVNTLVLRTDLSGGVGFRELLARVRRTALDAYAHQDVPFERLVEELQPRRNMSYSPLFQAMFVMQNQQQKQVEIEGLTLTALPGESSTAKFDLSLTMTESADGLTAKFEYNTDLFTADTIGYMAEHLTVLLESILECPDTDISTLRLLTADEEHLLLTTWAGGAASSVEMKFMHQRFEEQASRSPEAEAVVSGDVRLTYRELNERANRLAHYLQAQGVTRDTLVAVSVERTEQMVITALAILKAGGAYVPIDPAYPEERIAIMLRESNPALVLTDQTLDALQSELSMLPSVNPICKVEPDHLAYLIFTSGSTGVPKGVMIEHKSICNYLEWMLDFYQIASTDHVLQKASFSFDVSVWEMFLPLSCGAKTVLARSGGQADIPYLIELINQEQITIAHFIPSILQLFAADANVETCLSLRFLMSGGEALPFELQERVLERLPDIELHNRYGPTEVTVNATFWNCRHKRARKIVPIGRPLPNVTVYVLNAALQLVPTGAAGELYVGGDCLARGYYNRADLTEARFLPSPFQSGERIYKTGDRVRWLADGSLQFLGRLDDQVKLRGYRIELGEIEAMLDEHEFIAQSVAAVHRGEVLAVYYLGDRVPAADLRAYLKDRLPAFMVPSAFLQLENFPLGPNGKIDRSLLPIPNEWERTSEFVAPRTLTEERLAALWSELLRIEEISVYDSFFDLGGHSLMITQLVARVQQVFSVSLNLRELFEKTTIAELAEVIEASETVQAPVIQRRERNSNRMKR
ncbi:amino acid adenylation domain-containing protein [Tumebacillus sp. BK434]|uniref:non-ribosomal peptide synthetase n=1 Tax=Tumebacillus sp. BK434 TaxID=2512169 RepID=UPI00105382BF|nr:non-ribosomal peptide synthetase [Tumebacillus sp. BK434]TCP59053.1 amino acid adenylation domain-containing protein [Tumebacillus sp. BK434]